MSTTKPPFAMLNFDATTGEVPIISTDPGAAAGPVLSLIRQSATPAALDMLGYLGAYGMDAAGNRTLYASLFAQILDTTNGSEDGALFVSTTVAGVDTVTMSMLNGRVGIGNSAPLARLQVGGGAETPHGTSTVLISPAGAAGATVRNDTTDAEVTISAETGGTFLRAWRAGTNGQRLFVSVGSDDNIAGFFYRQGELNVADTGGGLVIGASDYVFGDPQQVGMQVHGSPYNTVASGDRKGSVAVTSGGLSTPFAANRSQGDGTLFSFLAAAVDVGSISVAAGVVSYNTFCGGHYAQLSDDSRPDLLVGTIVETVDELCAWTDENGKLEENKHLARFKVSDEEGSRAVYGVFAGWDGKERSNGWGDRGSYDANDAIINALGAFVVRIAKGVTVERGDYIESNGDGCGRVQEDDVLRSSTVAKVTAAIKVKKYKDGSYLVPCTLHCG
jgi:hypothetical protein